jgi:zinc protease
MSLQTRVAAALLLATLWVGSVSADPLPTAPPPGVPDSDVVKLDPRAVVGVLDNGMHYGVMRRSGTRDMSLLLYIKAGSANEVDGERGVAHFLEHMAFNGSKTFPANTVIQSFEDIGVALGRDQNAQTEFRATTYELDLSEITAPKVDLALRWLRDVADGLTLDQAEADRERGTIMSEYRSSQSAGTKTEREGVSFLGEGLLGPKRDPIGTPETIATINAKTLRSFYQKWYRPESATVVLVGDAPVQVLQARVEAAFGSWKNSTPAPPEPNLGRVPPRKLEVLVQNDPHSPNSINICRAIDKDPVELEDVNTHQRDFVDLTWTSTLQKRLGLLTQTANPPFISANVSREEAFDRASYACVDVSMRDQDWRDAVRGAAIETRRMEAYGITEDELRRAKAEYRATMDATVGSVETLASRGVAQLMLRNLTGAGTFDTAEEDRRVGRMAVERTSKATIDNKFRRAWTNGSGPLILVVGSATVSGDDVKKAWNEALATPPTPPVDQKARPWAYGDFGPPGTVVHREVDPDLDMTRLEFANGVRVNFKQTQNASDQVTIRIRFGDGQQEIWPADTFAGEVGANLLRVGGLGKNDFEDTARVCESHACSVEMAIRRDSFLMAGGTRPSDLDVELQLLTAYLVDPGFRPEVDARSKALVQQMYRSFRTDPGFVANLTRQETMAKPHVSDFPTEAEALAVKSTDMARALSGPMKHDALEVTIVGDVDEATATAALAKTLGAIPARDRRDHTLAAAAHVRFPSPLPPAIHAAHEGPTDKALVMATWPLFVWDPSKVREQRAISLLASIMRDRALDTIRHKLGKTYTPVVEDSFNRGNDQASMTALIETSPDSTEIVTSEIRKIAVQLAKGDLTDADLERVRRPVLDSGATRELTNEWWIQMLDGSQAHPDQITAARSWQFDYAGITLDELKAEAARWLSKPPLIIVVAPTAGAAKP